MTDTAVKTVDRSCVPIGLDAHRKWVELQFTVIENPHILICGGSQVGKTTLQVLIATVAASRGNIVIILDPKLRFAKPFRHPVTREPLANVLVYRNADPDIAAQEWHGVLQLLVVEMQRRYQADEQADASILADQKNLPTVLLVADELGTLLDFADKEWTHRKPEGYKGDTPIREFLHTLTRMGAEARVIGCFANQTASEKEMPAGTRTRQLCGQRVFLGRISEGRQWQMLAGDGVERPDIPDGQKGAGAIIVGDGKPHRFQGGLIDWKNHPEHVYQLAVQGEEILREDGHIDDAGHLLLGGVRIPRPGQMAATVTGGGVELPTAAAGPGPGRDRQEIPVPEPAWVTGLTAGAEFCGMSYSNFRKLRELYQIPGETRAGNQPRWEETELREWAMRHGERHRSGGRQGGKESA